VIRAVVKGGDELAALLGRLPVEVETKIMRNAMAGGARIIRDEARARAPTRSGALARSIKVTRNTKHGQIIAKVRLKGRHAFIGKFMEYGVLPHQIWAKGKGSLVIDGVAIGKQVWHPGHAPRPFMRPALDSRAAQAVEVIGDYLRNYLKFGSISVPPVAVDEEEAA
jgi:HK97 gp10 family phage protein